VRGIRALCSRLAMERQPLLDDDENSAILDETFVYRDKR